jgi:hypothetical protein
VGYIMDEDRKSRMRKLGFDKEIDRIEKGECPFCGKKIDPNTEYRDRLSRKEYELSGMCQKCQDQTFR